MKKLLTSFIIVVVLITIFATPAFADSENNMPGKAADLGLWKGLWNSLYRIGWGWHMGNGNDNQVGWGIGVSVRHAIFNIMDGEPPAHNW